MRISLVAALAGLWLAQAAQGAQLPSDAQTDCASGIVTTPDPLARPIITSGIAAVAEIPFQTVRLFCEWLGNEALGQMSRSDSLWFQAGLGSSTAGPATNVPGDPKWESPTPSSLFRDLPRETPGTNASGGGDAKP